MNKDYMNDIEKAVQTAAINGTLTKDAVDMFHGILTENKEQKEELSKVNSHLAECKKERDGLSRKVSDMSTKLGAYEVREVELASRESQHEVLQMTVKYEQKRVEDHKEMVRLVFRNTTVRKEVMTPLRGSEGLDQYNTQLPGGYASKDTVEEEEV